jgi:hypothetical protein
MAEWQVIIDAFRHLVQHGSQCHGSWRSDDDIVHILRVQYKTTTTANMLNRAIGHEFKDTNLASFECSLNHTGFIRISRKHITTDDGSMRKVSFYYIHKKTTRSNIECPTKTQQFQNFYDNNRHKGRSRPKRHALPMVSPPVMNKRTRYVSDDTAASQEEAIDMAVVSPSSSQEDMVLDEEEVGAPVAEDDEEEQAVARPEERAVDNQSMLVAASPPQVVVEQTMREESEVDSWERHGRRVRSLFGICNGNVRSGLQERIDRLDIVINRKGASLDSILTTPYKGALQLSTKTALDINMKATYLRLAYKIAMDEFEPPDGTTGGTPFKQCCTVAIDKLASIGTTFVKCPRTIMRWNREFRVQGRFVHPFEDEKKAQPFIFRDFPEAKDFAVRDLDKDLAKLSTMSALQYFRTTFVDKCVCLDKEDGEVTNDGSGKVGDGDAGNDDAGDDDAGDDDADDNREEFMKRYRLKTISLRTAGRWLRFLGYKYDRQKNCFYSDNHESEPNKHDRGVFNKKVVQRDNRKYKWCQITDETAKDVQELDDLPFHLYYTNDGTKMREYHVYVGGMYEFMAEFVSEQNRTAHGGDLSVRINGNPIIEVGQDESVWAQYVFSSQVWHSPSGKTAPRPKSEGDARMISAYIGPSIGFGANTPVSDEQLAQINTFRVGPVNGTYLSKEAAKEVLQTDKKKLFATAQDVRDSLCFQFEHGKNKEGYWNCYRQLIQHEDVIDILQGLFPEHRDFDFFYDQSCGHTKKMPGALNASLMNKFFGGAQPNMKSSPLTEEACVGKFEHDRRVHVGEEQAMQFGTGPDAKGPFWLEGDELEEARLPHGLKECPKNISDLKKELKEKDIRFSQADRRADFVKLANNNNIPLTKTVPIKSGWEGSPKGALQILYERGFIDPKDDMKKYSMDIKEDWLDEDGDIKDSCKKYYLRRLLEELPDFINAKTELEHLSERLSERYNITVTILFSPKYHCEIAGLGIEIAWGYGKKYYRRFITMEQKKSNFLGSVKQSLQQITPMLACKFACHVRRYIHAYIHFDSNEGEKVSYSEIEKFVKRAKTHRNTADQDDGYIESVIRKEQGVAYGVV